MHPILFEIAGLPFKTYTFFVILASFGSFLVLRSEAKRRKWAVGPSPGRWAFFAILKSTLIGFVGAHALYMVTRWNDLPFDEWLRVLIRFGHGNVWYGGLIVVALYCVRIARKNKIPLWEFGDMAALIGCVALGLGRFGCFFNGCCYGVPTDLPWGVTLYTREGYAAALHPTPIYEMLFLAVLFSYLWNLRARTRFQGQLLCAYLIASSFERFLIEFLRGDTIRGFVFGFLSTSQAIALALFTGAVVLRKRLKSQYKYK